MDFIHVSKFPAHRGFGSFFRASIAWLRAGTADSHRAGGGVDRAFSKTFRSTPERSFSQGLDGRSPGRVRHLQPAPSTATELGGAGLGRGVAVGFRGERADGE